MWETAHNSADYDCFKTQILPETFKTPSRHREAFLFFGRSRSNLCSNKLDVHETKGSLTQFHRVQS